MEVSACFLWAKYLPLLVAKKPCQLIITGIGPKVTQSVLTAAFLFAFKEVLYDLTIKARQRAALKLKA